MADVRDIMEMERPVTPELTKESLMATKKKTIERAKGTKRPEGMHREVFALLYNDNKDAPPLLPTDTALGIGSGYKQAKARLGAATVRHWEWAPFTNPARTDNAVFHHWQRVSDEPQEYPFAKFNKKLDIPTYSVTDYNTHLRNNTEKWTKAQTDHLFYLANLFDLRFIIMADRWDRATYGIKSVEDLKERYYEVIGILATVRGELTDDKKPFVFDADHERRRKEQLIRLYERTAKQLEEEQFLYNELRKIEMRKKERERKLQDLQKLISQADSQAETVATATTPNARKSEKKLQKKKVSSTPRVTRAEAVANAIEVGNSGIKFADLRGSGISLRSQKMKLPANVGQRKIKALEQALKELDIDPAPPATEEICFNYNELRSDLVFIHDLTTALHSTVMELQNCKTQYESAAPGKTLNIPAALEEILKSIKEEQ